MTPKLNRVLLDDRIKGFWDTGLKVYVGHSNDPQNRYTAMLYIERAMDEVTIENLSALARSSWVSDTPWYPMVNGNSLTELSEKMEARLMEIKGDADSMSVWYFQLWEAQYHISKAINARSEWELSSDELKLRERPSFMVPLGS